MRTVSVVTANLLGETPMVAEKASQSCTLFVSVPLGYAGTGNGWLWVVYVCIPQTKSGYCCNGSHPAMLERWINNLWLSYSLKIWRFGLVRSLDLLMLVFTWVLKSDSGQTDIT